MADPKPLTREQLAKFLPDHESVRRFERLFAVAGDLTPADVATLYRLSQEASIDAGIADSKAQMAVDALVQAVQDAAINAGAADGKAVQALELLANIAKSLELLAMSPVNREDTFLKGDYIDFPINGPHVTQERRVQWNSDDGTIDVGLFNNVVLQVGQETHFYVKNTSGSTITDGSSVMATGAVGASGKITCAPAVADGTVSGEYMLGIATQNIANNAFGYVTSFGLVRGTNTSGAPYGEVWADGDLLYLNPSIVGGLSKVAPDAPKLRAPVAIVINAASGGAGSIFVRMKTGEDLAHLNDVYAPAPAAGNVLIYDATQKRWEAAFLTPGANVTITNADGSITIGVAGAAPTGTAGGVLSGTYPNPGFATSPVKKSASSTNGAIPTWSGATGDQLNTGGLAAPSGTIVGTTDTQTLSGKTFYQNSLKQVGTPFQDVIHVITSLYGPSGNFTRLDFAEGDNSTNTGSVTSYGSAYGGSPSRNSVMTLGTAGTERMWLNSAEFRPMADNAYTLGSGTYRWSTVYAASALINTSDGRLKTDIQDLDEVEQRVAVRVKSLMKKFRFKDSVAEKGDCARIHFGVIAQQIIDAFAAEGLDASRYALLCHDTWEDQFEPVYEHREVEVANEETGVTEVKTEPQLVGQRLVTPAGDRYGIRYEELFAFIISAL